MALAKGKRLGGEFLNFKDLAREEPVVCVFRNREFCAPEPGDFGDLVPVIADVLIASGPRKGEVHLGERIIGALTAPLRGVKNPNKLKGIPVSPPANEIPGDPIVLHVKVTNPGKGNEGVLGDPPSEAEFKAAEAAYEAAGGDEGCWTAKEEEREPVAAAAGGGARKKPWDS